MLDVFGLSWPDSAHSNLNIYFIFLNKYTPNWMLYTHTHTTTTMSTSCLFHCARAYNFALLFQLTQFDDITHFISAMHVTLYLFRYSWEKKKKKNNFKPVQMLYDSLLLVGYSINGFLFYFFFFFHILSLSLFHTKTHCAVHIMLSHVIKPLFVNVNSIFFSKIIHT